MKTIHDHPVTGLKPDFRRTEDQTCFSQWERREVLVKFAGRCVVCNRTTYQPTGKNGHAYDPDPRGMFTERHAASHLVASEYSMSGPDVCMCFDCANTRDTYERGLSIARRQWKPALDASHGSTCASRMHTAAECTCGKADRPEGGE